MTPEQKQRIEQIRERQRQRRLNNFHYDVAVAVHDIDFLLSLVKSQEAVSDYSELAHEIISEYNSADSPSMLRQGVAQGLARVAASMRSACVEKLRAIQRKHEQTLPESEDYEYDQAAAFALCLAADQLESLSIEKPKE